ncbi:hypothetical protein [Streptomyces sp. NPDC091212]|uniref:hypothetical protein n=1 Tax=Streptomyces sp. NPDC091212 TaxID=3155191 RepID=UPI003426752C
MERPVITQWTGELAYALQRAYRKTNEAFAEQLGIAPRTVAHWHASGSHIPRNEIQQILDIAHAAANDLVAARFAHMIRPPGEPVAKEQPPAPRPDSDPVVAQMAADMALMQARMDAMQQQLGALALRFLSS